ncbi:hypothetical protein HY029_01905 [Candidatus Gottesmanbacteria bacterium]|nr:hypothetical protein [Candidatus Gottesmanbacteria bacterium]
MPLSLRKAILSTVSYADIFDYPLTAEEIWRWIIKYKNITMQQCNKEIKKNNLIQFQSGYFFLKHRKEIIDLRKAREKYSLEKLKTAQEIANLLKFIPSVKLVGITGALAMNNAKEEDDIDLFIITSGRLLWTTRCLSTLLVEITGRRRHPGESNINNKICLNMFVDEEYLEVFKKEQDLFSAHEVIQMKPLFERDNTYKKFLRRNSWVRKYLSNATESIKYKVLSNKSENKTPNLLENILRQFQLWYMRNRKTTEVIKEGVIRFHPHDARVWVMQKYRERFKKFKL